MSSSEMVDGPERKGGSHLPPFAETGCLSPALAVRARARDRRRLAIAQLTGEDLTLNPDTVPPLETRKERTMYVAHRIARGHWLSSDAIRLADVWGCAEDTVRDYAHTAALVVEMTVDDAEQMAQEAAHRIALRAELSEDDRVAQDADKTILQLTGHLKGGRDYDGLTEQQREEQMIAALRDPDPTMERWLRAAMSEPGEVLRGLLGEFGAVQVEGEER